MGSMMTLLSLYLSTHVRLFLCLQICPLLFPSFPLSSRVRRWLHSSNGCLLNLTSECNLCSLIQFCTTACPQNADQTQHNIALLYQIWPNLTHCTQLNRYINRSMHHWLHFKHPFSYTHMHDRPLNNTHTHPRSRATAIPLWMMRLSWDGDKWAFITTMIAPSSTRERDERKRRSPPFILFVHHLPCPRVLKA